MRVFLDSSVLLAAAGSTRGASYHLITTARRNGYYISTADYCVQEVEHNLGKLDPIFAKRWYKIIKPKIRIVPVRLTTPQILVYSKTKDRPVVITSLAENAEFLLTLDKADFKGLLGKKVYGVHILSPAEFLGLG